MSAHDTAHSGHQEHHEEPRSKTAFSASFWFVVILVGLFIAALNFINVMGHDEGGHGGHATEATSGHEAAAGHEATAAPAGEHAEATHEEHAATADTAAHHEEAAHH